MTEELSDCHLTKESTQTPNVTSMHVSPMGQVPGRAS